MKFEIISLLIFVTVAFTSAFFGLGAFFFGDCRFSEVVSGDLVTCRAYQGLLSADARAEIVLMHQVWGGFAFFVLAVQKALHHNNALLYFLLAVYFVINFILLRHAEASIPLTMRAANSVARGDGSAELVSKMSAGVQTGYMTAYCCGGACLAAFVYYFVSSSRWLPFRPSEEGDDDAGSPSSSWKTTCAKIVHALVALIFVAAAWCLGSGSGASQPPSVVASALNFFVNDKESLPGDARVQRELGLTIWWWFNAWLVLCCFALSPLRAAHFVAAVGAVLHAIFAHCTRRATTNLRSADALPLEAVMTAVAVVSLMAACIRPRDQWHPEDEEEAARDENKIDSDKKKEKLKDA